MTSDHGKYEETPRELYVLWGANIRMAQDWCDARSIRTSEIGRTVFPTSMEPEVLRGRRGPVTVIHHADGESRPFPIEVDWARRHHWNEAIDFINTVAS